MIVKGEDVVVYIFDGGQWKPYVCAKSCELNVSTDFLETSISGTGLFRTFLPTANSFTGSMDGIVDLFDDGSVLTLPSLRTKQLAQEVFLLRFTRSNSDSEYYTDEAMFFITNSTDSGSYDGINIFSISLQGTGVLTQLIIAPPNYPPDCVIPIRWEYTGIGGETIFIADGSGGTDDIRNKTILIADKDGTSFKVIFSGTPLGKEVRYTALTGQFEWGIQWEPNEEGFILYQ